MMCPDCRAKMKCVDSRWMVSKQTTERRWRCQGRGRCGVVWITSEHVVRASGTLRSRATTKPMLATSRQLELPLEEPRPRQPRQPTITPKSVPEPCPTGTTIPLPRLTTPEPPARRKRRDEIDQLLDEMEATQ